MDRREILRLLGEEVPVVYVTVLLGILVRSTLEKADSAILALPHMHTVPSYFFLLCVALSPMRAALATLLIQRLPSNAGSVSEWIERWLSGGCATRKSSVISIANSIVK